MLCWPPGPVVGGMAQLLYSAKVAMYVKPLDESPCEPSFGAMPASRVFAVVPERYM